MDWKECLSDAMAYILTALFLVGLCWGGIWLLLQACIYLSKNDDYCIAEWKDSHFQVRYENYEAGCQLSEDGVIWLPEKYYLKKRG